MIIIRSSFLNINVIYNYACISTRYFVPHCLCMLQRSVDAQLCPPAHLLGNFIMQHVLCTLKDYRRWARGKEVGGGGGRLGD